MALVPTTWTGTTWPGSYGPSGSLYYYGGRPYQRPEDVYAAMGQPFDPGVLPYGTTVYSPGYQSGMSDWDLSVRNNPYGPLDRITGPTYQQYAGASGGGGMFANPAAASAPAAAAGGTTTPVAATDPTRAVTGASTAVTGAGTDSTQPPAPNTTTTNPTGVPAGNYNPGPNSLTAADVFDPLGDPTASIYRALLQNNYNPDIPTWGMNQLMKRAADIAWGAAGRVAWGGNPDVLTTPGEMQNYISSLIGQAASGASGILPNAQQGRDYLNAINALTAPSATPSAGSTYLANAVTSSPQATAGLVNRLLYSGLAPSVRSALGATLANYPTRFEAFAEASPENFAVTVNRNALDILLNNLIPGFRPIYG